MEEPRYSSPPPPVDAIYNEKDFELPPPAAEVEEVRERGSSVKATIEDAAMNTGAHGIANIYRTNNIPRKVFWTIIVFAGMGIMLWQVTEAVKRYFTYPTSTTVEYLYSSNLPFPAVTICNNNPYVRSKVEEYGDSPELYQYFENIYDTWETAWDVNVSRPTEFETWDDVTQAPNYDYDFDEYEYDSDDYTFYSGEESEDFDFVEDFLSLFSTAPRKVKLELGHDLERMAIDCTWQGRECRSSQFYKFHNYLYGNCYTFNSGRDAQVLKTSKEGPLYAFKLALFVEQDEYLPGVADGAGIRLVVHNQTDMPIPDEHGINLKPGTKTSVGLTRKVVERIKEPHGECKDYSDEENKINNAFIDEYKDIGYSVAACKKTCYQKAVMKECGCFDYKIPNDYTLKAYEGLGKTDGEQGCYDDSAGYVDCVQKTALKFIKDELNCKEKCREKCLDVEYQLTTSVLEWPSQASTDRIMSELADSSEYFWNKITNASWSENDRKLWVRENFVKLEVYFKTFNYEYVKTEPAYAAFNLIADFGGQVGLWLGLSMIAIFEMVELITDLVLILIKRCRERRAARKHDVIDTEQWATPSKEATFTKPNQIEDSTTLGTV